MIQKRQQLVLNDEIVDVTVESAPDGGQSTAPCKNGQQSSPRGIRSRPSFRPMLSPSLDLTTAALTVVCLLSGAQFAGLLDGDHPAFQGLVAAFALCGLIALMGSRRKAKRGIDAEGSYLDSQRDLETLQDRNWELQEREHRHRTLVEAFGDMIMDRHQDGTIYYMNPEFISFLGLEKDGLIGHPFPEDFFEDRDSLAKIGRSQINEIQLSIGGKRKWLAWLDLPVQTNGSTAPSYRTVARDITRHKQVEMELRSARSKAETASEAKTRFLANVSHEMRTPLNGILGMSGLLADTRLTPEQISYVNAVHDSGVALLTLIEDILDMTLVESNRLELRAVSVSPHRVVEDVCELLAPRAHSKQISIASYIAGEVPGLIEADAGRLRQVLINLIGNAIKFTETGGVFISAVPISDKDASPAHPILEFRISDTGPGIKPEDQKLIFEEFSQADSRSTRQYGGAGLGLTISRRIVEAMGGTIAIESVVGSGSTFVVRIPVCVLQSEPEGVDASQADADWPKVTILSDDQMTTQAIEHYLREIEPAIGMACEETRSNGHQEVEDHEVVLVDSAGIADPRTTATSYPTRIKKIILLNPDQRTKLEEFLSAGFDGYLIKPIRKASLLAIIKQTGHTDDTGHETSRVEQWSATMAKSDDAKLVLLAEDNDINALLARSVLEKGGHRVVRAHNGSEAVSLFKERETDDRFDAVFLDLQMPVMDGLEALSQIRRLEREEMRTPVRVHILTADEQEQTRSQAISHGADGFLTKPLNPKTLLDALAEAKINPTDQ